MGSVRGINPHRGDDAVLTPRPQGATAGISAGRSDTVTMHNWTMKHSIAVVVITLLAVGAFLFSWT